MSASVVDISSPFAVTRRTPVPAAGVDAAEVERQVRAYACRIGCDASNVTAALSYAVRWGGTTEQAVDAGIKRAAKLRAQQPDPPSAA